MISQVIWEMAMDWDYTAIACGNCRYWPAKRESYGVYGIGGPHTDGSVSDCRRHPPIAVRQDRYPHSSAVWPATNREDWCGEFELVAKLPQTDKHPSE